MVIGFFSKFILGKDQDSYNLKGELFLLLAGILATLIRFVGSVASSIIIYKVTLNVALVYNAIYIPVSGALATAILMAAYGPIAKVNRLYPVKKAL